MLNKLNPQEYKAKKKFCGERVNTELKKKLHIDHIVWLWTRKPKGGMVGWKRTIVVDHFYGLELVCENSVTWDFASHFNDSLSNFWKTVK